ncbi:hypothetical protein AT395_24850 (plasmid) [Pandoraea apista]|nr:hypothetical protein AT395_24850 [Pandoraea apista]
MGSVTKWTVYLAASALLSACGEHAQPGSLLAARFAAAEAVGKAYKIDPVHVNEEPEVVGEVAHVKTTFSGGACTVELVKRALANRHGWLAKTITCDKSA